MQGTTTTNPVAEKIIRITNKDVISFYQENKHLDITAMNLLFIDIMKNLSVNLSSTMTSTVNSKLLDLVTQMNANVNNMKMEMVMKLHESKKDYLNDVKSIINTTSLENLDKLNNLLERSSDNLVTKTTCLLNEVVPKTQEKNKVQLEEYIKTQCSTIASDTQKLLALHIREEKNKSGINDMIDGHLNRMLNSIQQPLMTIMNQNEDRNLGNFASLRETLISQKEEQSKLSKEISDFLSRYKNNSQVKGHVGETQMMHMLTHLMPSDEVTRVNGSAANCDIRVRRNGGEKPTILFECKDHSLSVDTKEVEKFERDVQEQKTHGIMVSHKSPITFKSAFEINIINNLIHVYVPNCDYSSDKLKIAIDIVDSLHNRLLALEKDKLEGNISLARSDYFDLVREYTEFADKKADALEQVKRTMKLLQETVDKIEMPKLKNWFISNGNLENDSDLLCRYCHMYEGKSKTSLGAHIRKCKMNPTRVIVPEEEEEKEVPEVVIEKLVVVPTTEVKKEKPRRSIMGRTAMKVDVVL